jgi:hypothetical protein
MYKKLVIYDKWHFAEVDPVCLKRIALVLHDQISRKIPKDADIYSFCKLTMPVIDEAVRGNIVESLDLDTLQFVSANYRHDKSEGTLPLEYDADFRKSVSEFTVAVQGLPLEQISEVFKDGVTYAWVDFEEEGDWPDKVKYK